MAKQIICDRCNTPLNPGNWHDDNELCDECIILIDMASIFAAQDIKNNRRPGEKPKKNVQALRN